MVEVDVEIEKGITPTTVGKEITGTIPIAIGVGISEMLAPTTGRLVRGNTFLNSVVQVVLGGAVAMAGRKNGFINKTGAGMVINGVRIGLGGVMNLVKGIAKPVMPAASQFATATMPVRGPVLTGGLI